MDLSQALRSAAGRLRAAGVPSPEVDARLMAAHLLGVGPMDVLTYAVPGPFVAAFTQHFEAMVARREAREPLQHILGVAPFGPLELEVGPGVFIPRPETEVLADWAVRQLAGATHPTVVDLCTGSGALALYIAHYVPRARVIAVELSDAALTYTRRNCAGSRVEVVHGDATDPELLRELDGQVDVLVSNPPYVPETPDLDPEVYQDPHMAVFGGADGMTVIDRMVGNIGRLVAPGGAVGIEHDDATSELTQRALRRVDGLTDIAPLSDLTGTARFVVARMGDLPRRSFTAGQTG